MCAERKPPRPQQRQRGLSIVEVMVGLVVSLLIGLAASTSARVFTASQRQGIGVGGMSANAATALAALKSDAASAGLGFFGNSSFSCYRLDLSVGGSVKSDAGAFAPVKITSQGASDQLDVVFSTNIDGGADVLLYGTSNGGSAKTQSRLPAAVGNAVLLVPATPGAAAAPCMVRSVTGITAATDDDPHQTLTFANTGSYNQAAFTATPAYDGNNKDRITLLGTLHWNRYRISGTDLLIERPLDGADPSTLLRNVMAFRVQYGISANDVTKTLTGWQDATAADATWAAVGGSTVDRVRALRIGLVTRSAQREKANAAGSCEASTDKPTLFGTTVEPDVADWRCYRYRTAVVIVPLRNLVW